MKYAILLGVALISTSAIAETCWDKSDPYNPKPYTCPVDNSVQQYLNSIIANRQLPPISISTNQNNISSANTNTNSSASNSTATNNNTNNNSNTNNIRVRH